MRARLVRIDVQSFLRPMRQYGVEEIQVSVWTRAGERIAIIWAIIPPSETPTMCAPGRSSAGTVLRSGPVSSLVTDTEVAAAVLDYRPYPRIDRTAPKCRNPQSI